MKILQINSVYEERSTGRTCKEVERAVIANGDQCITAYGFGPKRDTPNAYKIDTPFEYYLHGVLGRLTGLNGYFSVFATIRLVRFIKKYDPDVIHLRNLHGFYINLPILFSYLKKSNKAVIQNIHDCWIFTGKCTHYTVNNCYKWKTECDSHCPKCVVHQYPKSVFFDFSRKMFRDKKKWLTSLPNLTVVGVSNWTVEQATQSFLRGRRVIRIYNWIDLEAFKPYEGNVLADYGLDPELFTVVCAGVSWNGTEKYEQLKKLIKICDADVQFLIIGDCTDRIDSKNVAYAGYVFGTSNLAKLYSSSDVYVHFSMEDTFGKVIAEALACGTPAIVYDSTSCSEIIDDSTGCVVPPNDIQAVYDAVRAIQATGKKAMVSACRNRVEKYFEYQKNVGELIMLYKEVCNV